ncbi:pheromone-regulated protein prm10 [Coemansia sp. RSA 1853]|nr:pheromone-regulated protein prm10 [Coemansia sp. RSA 638]KAJ2543766.1 pheromone-regulated protein prm10 [Coemansia sp. RSA 1853]
MDRRTSETTSAEQGQKSLVHRRLYPNDSHAMTHPPHITQLRNPRNISERPQYHPLPNDLTRAQRRTRTHLSQIPETNSEHHSSDPNDQLHEPSMRMFDSPPFNPVSVATVVSSRASSTDSESGLFIQNISRSMGAQPKREFTPGQTPLMSPITSPPSSGAVTPHMLESSEPPDMATSNFDANHLAAIGKDNESISIRVDSRKRAKNMLRRLEGKAEPSNGSVLGNLIRLHSVMTGNGRSEHSDTKKPRNVVPSERPAPVHLPHSKSWSVLPNIVHAFRHPKKTPVQTPDSSEIPRAASMVDVRNARMGLSGGLKAQSAGLTQSMSSARMSALMMTPEAFARNGIIPPPSTHSTLRMNEKLASGYFELDPRTSTTTTAIHDERTELIDTIAHILEKQDFLMHLARAWHAFGSPVHRMEANLLNVAKYLNIEACFFSVPGLTLISFGDPDTHSSETHIVRASDGYDMYRLEQVNRISRRLRKGNASVHESIRDIETLMAKPAIYPWYMRLAFSFIQSFFVSMTLFHGSWREAALSGGLGTMVGAFELLSSTYLSIGYLLNILPPLIAALVAALLSNYICYAAVPMAASINLLPGMGLALAMMELSSNNVICGAVRLVSATMTSFMIGWGTIVGYQLGMAMLGKEGESTSLSNNECQGMTMLWWILFLPLTTIGFSVWFKVHWKRWPAVIVAASAGLVIQTFCDRVHVMTNISAGIASFAVGIISNIYGHFTHSATNADIVFVGIIQLVPGSTGVRSFISYMSADSSASSLTMNMLTSAISIAVGLILSNSAMYSELKRFRLGSF